MVYRGEITPHSPSTTHASLSRQAGHPVLLTFSNRKGCSAGVLMHTRKVIRQGASLASVRGIRYK